MQDSAVREREAAPLAITEYRPSTLRYILFHQRVLRVGWGVLLFGGLFWLITVAQTVFLIQISRFPRPSGSPFKQPRDLLLPQLLALISVAIATVAPSLLEQRRVGQYGFESEHGFRLLGGGLLSGLSVASMLVLALRQFGFVTFAHPAAWNLGAAVRQGVTWACVYGVLALMLTMLTRGYPQYTLTRGFAYVYRTFFLARSGVSAGFWTAAFLLSTFAALLQTVNQNESPAGIVWAGSMSVLLCLSLWRTGSLWWAIGFQAAWDWTQAFVFGVPDSGLLIRDHLMVGKAAGSDLLSGGAVGPEGSLLSAGAFVLMLGLVLLLKKRVAYPDLWQIAEADYAHRAKQIELSDPDLAR